METGIEKASGTEPGEIREIGSKAMDSESLETGMEKASEAEQAGPENMDGKNA